MYNEGEDISYTFLSIWCWKNHFNEKSNKNIIISKFQYHILRTPRSNEVNGVDYYFVSKLEFKKLIDKNSFYEYAKIYETIMGP